MDRIKHFIKQFKLGRHLLEQRYALRDRMREAQKTKAINTNLVDRDPEIIAFLRETNPEHSILLCGFPKSGNTWVRFLIYNYFNILHRQAEATLGFSELNELQPHLIENFEPAPFPDDYPNLFRTHQRFRRIFTEFDQVVYIYRNPLDNLVSFYHWWKDRTPPFYRAPESEREKLHDIDYFVEYHLPEWMEHYQRTVPKSDLVLCYEDMKENIDREFKRIIDTLGFPYDETAFKKAIAFSAFDSIKKMGRERAEEKGMGDSDRFHGEHTRSGAIGQYEGVLKTETIEKVKAKLKAHDIAVYPDSAAT